ncbi:MAG: hypothetical protein K0Q95_1148 [Bacteroidota bacterium]|jgi:hypothetical protein|nr:hypothetical protein [Bacteroidota bacterium]
MTQEDINYKQNLQNFIDVMKDCFVTSVSFQIDFNPTFDKRAIPFDFRYCHSVIVIADKEIFDISTSITTYGVDTFWIKRVTEVQNSSSYLQVESKVKNIHIKYGYGNYPYQIHLEFEKSNLILFASEIYDREDGHYDYKFNDEMIMVFENLADAATFEKYLTTANTG